MKKKRKKGFKSRTLLAWRVFVLIASLAAFSYRSYSAMDFAQFDWEYRAGPGKNEKMVRPLLVRLYIYIYKGSFCQDRLENGSFCPFIYRL